jgi:hypothetical protein
MAASTLSVPVPHTLVWERDAKWGYGQAAQAVISEDRFLDSGWKQFLYPKSDRPGGHGKI